MCILVTGAAGFIGYHTSRALLDRGDEIIAVDNLNAYYDGRLKEARLDNLRPRKGFQFIRGDLTDRAAVECLFETHRPSAFGPYLCAPFPITGNRLTLFHRLWAVGSAGHGAVYFCAQDPGGRSDFNEGHHARDFTYVDDIMEGVVRVVNYMPEPNPAWSGDHPDPYVFRALPSLQHWQSQTCTADGFCRLHLNSTRPTGEKELSSFAIRRCHRNLDGSGGSGVSHWIPA